MNKILSGFLFLLSSLGMFLLTNGDADAAIVQRCSSTRILERRYIGCSNNDGPGYCRVDSSTMVSVACYPANNCTTGTFYSKYTACKKPGSTTANGDINDACYGNELSLDGSRLYRRLDSSAITSQCYYSCNDSYGACQCPAGTQTNGCGDSRSCSCCNTTAPTNLSVAKISSSTWQLTWNLGNNGTSQRVYVDDSQANVQSNCASGGCNVADTSVGATTQSYDVPGLVSGTYYYFRVVTYQSGSCSSASTTASHLTSCDVSPSSLSLQLGDTQTLTSGVYASSEIGSVAFTPSSGFVSVNPGSDSSYVYSTLVSADSIGSGTITSDVKSPLGATLCTSISDVTVNPRGPWWQVVDADVQTNGDLDSNVPPIGGQLFGLDGLGGFPGVAKFGGSTSLDATNVSSRGWLANSMYSPLNNRVQNYAFFRRQIPDDTVLNPISTSSVDGTFFESGGTESYGYFWYDYDGASLGDLSITSAINLPAGRKVIILATGADLYINGSINYTSGDGFLLSLVEGDIYIDPAVGGSLISDLQGFYMADGNIYTGVSAITLRVKGSMAAHGSLTLQRDLGDGLNGTTPSESFEYDPASIFLFPSRLSIERTSWKEVSP